MIKHTLLLSLIVAFVSCTKSPKEDSVTLLKSDKVLSFTIPDDVRTPQVSVFPFMDGGESYLSFENFKENEIIIYDIKSSRLIKRVKFDKEGNNAIVGGFGGYYIVDMNHIFLPSLYMSTIYVADTTAIIQRQIDYQSTQSGLYLVPFIPGYDSQMTFLGDSLYIPQSLNRMLKEKIISDSPVMAVVDTVSKEVMTMPLKFPPLINKEDLGTAAGGGCDFSCCYDGNRFVYSFFYDDNIYVTSYQHKQIDKIMSKSKYIDKAEVFRPNESDFQQMVKQQCEHASYGQIIYDKYRDVYYRIAYPPTNIDSHERDYVELLRSGGKQFSVIVLDKELNIIGETLFPEYTYNPKLFMILEDGLYISMSHIKNPDYSDDLLRFQKFELTNKLLQTY